MSISQLKGAAGVAIRTVDLSGRPATDNNAYKVGLVGWTPQGPTNAVTLVKDTSDLYSLFGYPTGYSANQVAVLHNAKIMLDAGCQVQMVRAVDGSLSSLNETFNYAAFTYAAPTDSAPNIVSGSAFVSNVSVGNKSNNISNLTEFTLSPYADVGSPFTAFLKYPGFTGYQLSFQSFQTFGAQTEATALGDQIHSLNLVSDDTYYSDAIGDFRNFVLGLGLYQDYQVTSSPVALSTTGTGLARFNVTSPVVSATGSYYVVTTTTSSPTITGYAVTPQKYTVTDATWSSGTKYTKTTTGGVTVYTPDAGAGTLQLTITASASGTFYATTSNGTAVGYSTAPTAYNLTVTADVAGTYYADASIVYSTTSPFSLTAYGDRYYTDGKFYRYSGALVVSGAPTVGATIVENTKLNDFIKLFGIIRTYASVTASSPIETLYFTLNDYVTPYGQQLAIADVDSVILNFKKNSATTVTTWINSNIARTTLSGGTVLKFGTETTRNAYTLAWKLFEDIENVDVRALVDGGSTIVNFANDPDNTDMETVDIATVTAMLTTSSVRQDAPSVLDLPKTRVPATLVKKFVRQYPAFGNEVDGSTASYATYWGNAQDGRQLITDIFNQKQIEAARSVFKAVAMFNVYNTSYPWQTSWGPNRGAIGAPSIASLNVRKYPDDIGLLSKNRINSSKLSANGEFFWDDYSLQSKSSILQRWHAVVFLADLNRRYRTILEQFVAELNTPDLRRTIYGILNEDLNFIKNVAKPAGLYNYYVICDESNNPPSVVDAEQLNVDIGLEITRDTRVILLTTTLYRTGGIVLTGIKAA
jgi:hypothetical protein